MNFFSIFGIVLCWGTYLVGADFYLEFQAATGASSSRGNQRMAYYLYECKGIPAGTPAYTAPRSLCTPVTERAEKVNIYLNCNFYSVYKPRLLGQIVRFSDNRRVVLSEIIWYVGFKNDAIDHPYFPDTQVDDLADFLAKVEQMAANGIVPQQLVNDVALYLAKTNFVHLSGVPTYLDQLLSAYTNVLGRITHLYGNIHQAAPARREQYGDAMKVLLQKMVDPCAVLQGQVTDDLYCERYCNFLTVVARHFGPVSNRCTSFQGGQCVSLVCTCVQVLDNPFSGCQNPTSAMQLCNNEMRAKLKL